MERSSSHAPDTGPAPSPAASGRWQHYLQQFHDANPGITDDVIGNAHRDGTDPYQWLLEPLRGTGPVLDLACGNGPLVRYCEGRPWVGIDRSAQELRGAATRAPGTAVRGDVTALPFSDDAVETVACSMALMIIEPFDTFLHEVRRVLRTGGVAAFLVPDVAPLTLRDMGRYIRLLLSLRQVRFRYPNDGFLKHLEVSVSRAGLSIIDDQRRRFVLPLTDADHARGFVESLYLPDVDDVRAEAAVRLVTGWTPFQIGIPLRRIVIT